MSNQSPQSELLAALGEVRGCFERDEEFWRERLVQTFLHFLRATDVNPELWAPVFAFRNELAQNRLKPDHKVAHPNTAIPMAAASAGATTLKQRHGYPMEKALLAASKASKIERAKLKTFRNNISSGNVSAETRSSYDAFLAEFKIYTAGEVISALGRLRGFVK